jgi:hypothetical protein
MFAKYYSYYIFNERRTENNTITFKHFEQSVTVKGAKFDNIIANQ